jgi:hypothetical protein
LVLLGLGLVGGYAFNKIVLAGAIKAKDATIENLKIQVDNFKSRDSENTPQKLVSLGPTADMVQVVGKQFSSSSDPKVTYKNKLWIIFKNVSDKAIIVGPNVDWRENKLVGIVPGRYHVWQVDAGKGWSQDSSAVRVAPGQQFRTWIGLNENSRATDVSGLLPKQAGTIETSITPANDLRFEI